MCRAACVSRPPSQIGCILSLAASKSLTSRASSLRRSVRSCTAFPLCVAPAQPHAPSPLKVTVSAISAANVLPAPAKINEVGRTVRLVEHVRHFRDVIGVVGLLLNLVPSKRTSGHGRSKGLPDRLMGYVIECLVEAYILIGAGGRLT